MQASLSLHPSVFGVGYTHCCLCSWFTILYDFVTPFATVLSRLPGATLKLRRDTFSIGYFSV